MDKQKYKEILLGGVVSNPVFVLVIGMCPVIAQSNTIDKAFALGCATAFVLIFSNFAISCLRKLIPDTVRIPVYIVIISSLTTILILFMQSYFNDLYNTIGPFLSLVAVNCLIMARIEVFSSKNNPLYTLMDSFSMGVGFLGAITMLGVVRQLLTMAGFALFDTAAGGFLVLGLLIALCTAIVEIIKKCIDNRRQRIGATSQLESSPTDTAL